MAVYELGIGTPDGLNMGKATQPISFHQKTPTVTQQTIADAGTDAATTQALANDLRLKLIALGLVVAS